MELTQTQIKNGWRVVKLGEVVDLQQGLAINIKSKHLLVEKSNLALLRITDLINKKEVQYVDEKLVPSQFIAENNSLIYSRTGQVGLVFRNRKGVVHNNCFKIIPHDQIKKDFLYYILQQESFYKSVNQIAQKAAQPDLTHTAFKSLEILLPKVESQEKIAEVLSAYDDLIENNEKRIKILEQMAQKLYTEWFVKFKFPGHEFVAMVDSGNPDFGMVPEEWEVRKVVDIIERVSAGKKYDNNTSSVYGNIPILDQGKTGVIGYHNDEAGLVASPEKPIIVFANHTCYQNLIMFPFSGIQNILPFKSNSGYDIFWLHFATKDLIKFNDYKGHWPEFMMKNLVVPLKDIAEEFGIISGQSMRLKFQLEKQNQNLKKSRDLLISQLVSGKLEIK